MTAFTQIVLNQWVDPFQRGTVLRDSESFRLSIDEEADSEYRVQILTRDACTFVLVSPGVAELPGIREATNEAEVRGALTAGGLTMNGADYLFFLPENQKAELRGAQGPSHIRRLTAADEAAFKAFESAAPGDDFDEAFVALDHWAVFGAFEGEALIAAGSAYPFDEDTLLADLGVITLPSHRGQGHARAVVRALSRHALAQGLEPQYRCQLDNTSSVVLAARSGFVSLGTWDVPLPDMDDDDDYDANAPGDEG